MPSAINFASGSALSTTIIAATNVNGSPPALEAAPNQPTIAVIGAGVAGLRAAQVLLEKGYNVVIYEARDRIGGRIFTSERLEKPVDLGPNWIHGTTNNPIIPLSQQSRSTLYYFSSEAPAIAPTGELLDQNLADELHNLLWQVVDRTVQYSRCYQSEIPKEKSFYDYCVEKANELFGVGDAENEYDDVMRGLRGDRKSCVERNGEELVKWKEEEERKKQLWLAMTESWGTFIGSSVQRQSLRFFFLEEPLEGPNIFVASTYKPMVEILAMPSQEANIINLSTPISDITSTTTKQGQKRILLQSPAKPITQEFDGVIVTAPLGCLKRDMIKFEPELPQRIKESISSLNYGQLEKVYIQFPRAFWKDGPDNMTFLSPQYAQKTNPNSYHTCLFSLAHLPEPYAQPALLFYIFGPTSEKIVNEFPSPETRTGKVMYINFFKPYFSKLHGYKESDVDCIPTEVVATAWQREKWTGYGSYSNFQIGLGTGEEDILKLQEGCGERRVWFAGEHAAPVLGLGSVSGAYWSGEDAARKVITELEGQETPNVLGMNLVVSPSGCAVEGLEASLLTDGAGLQELGYAV